ncbi:MAG TPA: ATP-binding protein [Flavipsychrobacter sp.]|nr:ATP-binding protein [Flavipsychrobacter sp.]
MIDPFPTIKNIVNKNAVNIDNCESEAIHVPGSLQPHGFLLAIHPTSYVIEFASENTRDFIETDVAEILGKKLHDFFPAEECNTFYELIQEPQANTGLPVVFSFKEIKFNASIHSNEIFWILELEPFPDGKMNLPNLYQQTKQFTSYLETTESLQDLCRKIAEETREITGYDRVMIYKFDEAYNGEVFAESKREDLESFLGLHYPHTDIPPQARLLYLKNLMRMIADVNYTPVPIYTKQNADNADLDLSCSFLRSISPIHIEYLKNMDVRATLTISLVSEGKLWGLIACHHYTPRNIPYYTRFSAQLQGHFLTSQIKVREIAEEYSLTKILEDRLHKQLETLNDLESFLKQIGTNKLLSALTNAGGVAVVVNDSVYCQGVTPKNKDVFELVKWLKKNVPEKYYTSHLAADYPNGEKISKEAAGLIYQSINRTNNNCIVWFKPEAVEIIKWAGNPSDAVVKNEKMSLSPRKSFELWKQEVRHKSTKWAHAKLHIASTFAYALQRLIYATEISENETRYRLLSEKLQKAYEEISNLNWISTHDLKEPLRKIQIFASKILSSDTITPDSNNEYALKRMQTAASRMQQLIDDIRTYAIINEKEEENAAIDLQELLNEILDELAEETEATGATITIVNLPTIKGVKFQLHQLFTNLITNALKFTSTHPEITIYGNESIEKLDGQKYLKITVADNGIGFEPQFASKIFTIFQRLHEKDEYAGTGIGLAICKKIMERHRGKIIAEGEKGKGAKFLLYFPVE